MRLSLEERARLAVLKAAAEVRVTELMTLASRTFARPIRRPTIRFDLVGQSAGQARIDGQGGGLIRFNPWLLLRYGDVFIRQTVPHETAHWLVFCLVGRHSQPHGREWRQLMKLFGAEPRRCHQYALDNIPQRQVARYSYYCACGEHKLSAVRHNRIKKGQTYQCRRCGTALRPRVESAS